MKTFHLKDHADSLLPEDKEWKLVWHDEFDGNRLDRSKWDFRLNFWGRPFPAFTEDGVILDGESHLQLHLVKKDGKFCSPHLQTGSLTYDIPKDTNGFWPFGKLTEPKFMHKFGYYEVRCRLPKNPGWHAAFWLQAPGVGSHPDARIAGVECDVMETLFLPEHGKLIGGNYWGGYGKNYSKSGHFAWDYEETEDGWHQFGVDWSRDSYRFYADGKLIGRVVPPEQAHLKNAPSAGLPYGPSLTKQGSITVGPVSEVDQFILLSTECRGYRATGAHDPVLENAVLPDYFEVDFVRVFDAVP